MATTLGASSPVRVCRHTQDQRNWRELSSRRRARTVISGNERSISGGQIPGKS
jgi:hypothetical protein